MVLYNYNIILCYIILYCYYCIILQAEGFGGGVWTVRNRECLGSSEVEQAPEFDISMIY